MASASREEQPGLNPEGNPDRTGQTLSASENWTLVGSLQVRVAQVDGRWAEEEVGCPFHPSIACPVHLYQVSGFSSTGLLELSEEWARFSNRSRYGPLNIVCIAAPPSPPQAAFPHRISPSGFCKCGNLWAATGVSNVTTSSSYYTPRQGRIVDSTTCLFWNGSFCRASQSISIIALAVGEPLDGWAKGDGGESKRESHWGGLRGNPAVKGTPQSTANQRG